jgi:hypothetical protein
MLSYQIKEFFGIQQQKDGALLPEGSASDARNIDTSDGNLAVAKGYVKHISTIIPGSDKILKLIVARGATDKFYVVTANKIYVFKSNAWATVYTFASALTSTQIDYYQTQINSVDCLIIATGETQMVKINLTDDSAVLFGTGETSFSGTVESYNAGTKVITLSATLSAEALRHAPLDGITINGVLLEVESATGATVTLSDAPESEPTNGQSATIRGGGSTAKCNFVDMHYGRLFSCGDPDHPCRLYWSAVPGDGRTYEDWLAVEGSEDASGGSVEIGDASGDAIIGLSVLATETLIFKRYSVYRVRGDRPSQYAIERVENFSEQMSNASVVVKYNTPQYITMSGVHYYDGTGILPMDQGVKYLKTFFESLNSVSESKGVHCANKLYFSCKANSASTYDDTVIVYDIARASYMLRDGFEIADMTVHNGHIYLINGSRYVYEFDSGTSYDGVNIEAYWKTQKTDLGARYVKKQLQRVMFRASEGFLVLTLNGDNAANTFYSELTDGVAQIDIQADQSVTFELVFANEAGSQFSINGGLDVLFDKEAKP